MTTTTEEISNNVFDGFNTIFDSLSLFKMQISTLQQQLRTIEKNVKKEMKTVSKRKNKKDGQEKVAKKPSGFAKPTKVTKELCNFMNRPIGTEIARTEVTKALVSYIKEHKLQEQNTEAKNKIIPDQKLKSLLGIQDNEIPDLTFFSIQKYMNKHFNSKKNQLDEDA